MSTISKRGKPWTTLCAVSTVTLLLLGTGCATAPSEAGRTGAVCAALRPLTLAPPVDDMGDAAVLWADRLLTGFDAACAQ